VSPTAFRLRLPRNWSIHPTFHISLLEPYKKSTDPERGPPDLDQVLADADLLDGEEGHKIKEIKDSWREKNTRRVKYLVEWEGEPDPKDWTVQVFEDFTNLEPGDKGYESLDEPERDYIREFHERYPEKPIDARDLARWSQEGAKRKRKSGSGNRKRGRPRRKSAEES
jgi:hypothetical protein